MAIRFLPGSHVDSSKASGFTLIEAMVSVSIIALMAVSVSVSLRSSQKHEEIITTTRVVAGDLRSLQASALTAQNIRTCKDASNKNITCVLSVSSCENPAACVPLAPMDVGAHFFQASSTYAYFADVDVANQDHIETVGAGERYQMRDLKGLGGPSVTIDQLLAPGPVSATDVYVSFDRQNGSAHIISCVSGVCSDVPTMIFRLKHASSGEVKDVSLNAITGRVSVE